MKYLLCVISILLYVHSVFPCVVDIWNLKVNSVYGRVKDEYGSPIPNASIQIYKNEEEGEKILAQTKADENGRFKIDNFPSGKYMVKANSEGFTYSYAFMKLKKSSSKSQNKEIIFTLVPHGKCSGKVEVKTSVR